MCFKHRDTADGVACQFISAQILRLILWCKFLIKYFISEEKKEKSTEPQYNIYRGWTL